MAGLEPLSRIVIVLVDPKEPGNVGAAARAMKTMGLSRLVVVGGCDLDTAEARRMAHGSQDLLRGAERRDTLGEALADCRMALATTHRRRRGAPPVQQVEAAVGNLVTAAARGPAAVVFGRESRGLTTAELALCTELCRLPTAAPRPSLNLAQAVMVFAWEIARAAGGVSRAPGGPILNPADATTQSDRAALMAEWRDRLREADLPASERARLGAALQALLRRPGLTRVDLGALRRLVRSVAGPRPPQAGGQRV